MLKDYEEILHSYANVPSRLSHNVTFLVNLLNFSHYRRVMYIKTNLVHETYALNCSLVVCKHTDLTYYLVESLFTFLLYYTGDDIS